MTIQARLSIIAANTLFIGGEDFSPYLGVVPLDDLARYAYGEDIAEISGADWAVKGILDRIRVLKHGEALRKRKTRTLQASA